MAKGQQKSNKETKKPKKDTSSVSGKNSSSSSQDSVRPMTVTTLVPKRKDRNKQDF
jgi:hypothetical protein